MSAEAALRFSLLASLSIACIAEEPSILPATPGVRSVALIRDNAEGREVFTFDVEDPASFAERLDGDAELPLYVSMFEAPLAELGLPAGRLEIAEPGTLSHPLPAPIRALEAVRRDGQLHWEGTEAAEAAARSTWLVGERLRTRACPEISVISQFLPLGPEAKRWISVAEPLADGSVLLATSVGEWMRTTPERIDELSALSSSVAHGASFRDRNGRIWLAHCEEEGLFWMDDTLVPDRPLAVRCGDWTSSGAFVVRMDGAPSGQPNELVTMSRSGRVLIYDEERNEEELYFLSARVILEFVSWDEPGKAVLTIVEPEIIELERGQSGVRVRPDWKPRGEPPKFYRARRMPEGLALVGEDGEGRGIVMIRDRARREWHLLGGTGVVGSLYEVMPTSDGFAFAGASRQVGWWTPETGFCPAPYFGPPGPDGRPSWDLGSFSFYVIVPVSDEVMFVAGFVSLSETSDRVWWVRRQR